MIANQQPNVGAARQSSALTAASDWERRLDSLNEKYVSLKNKTIELINSTVDKKKYDSLEKDYNDLKIQYAELNNKLVKLNSQLPQLLEKTGKLQSLNSELKTKFENLLEANKQLTARLEDYEKLKSEKLTIAAQYDELQHKFANLFANSKKMLTENIELKKSIENLLRKSGIDTSKLAEFEKLSVEKEKLIADIAAKEKDIQSLIEKNSQLTATLDGLKKQVVESRYSELKKTDAIEKSAQMSARETAGAAVSADTQTADKNKSLSERLAKLYASYNELKNENERIKSRNSGLLKAVESSLKKYAISINEIDELKRQVETNAAANMELSRKIKDLDAAQKSGDDASKEIVIEKLKNELNISSAKIDELTQKAGGAADKTQLDILRKQKVKLLEAIIKLESDNKLRSRSFNEKLELLAQQFNNIAEHNNALAQINKRLGEQNENLKNNLTTLAKNLDAALISDGQNDKLAAGLNAEVDRLKNIAELNEKKIKELTDKNLLLETENDAVGRKISVYNKMITELSARLKSEHGEKLALKSQVDELTAKLSDSAKGRNTAGKIADIDQNIEFVNRQLTSELEKLIYENSELKTTIKSLNERIERLTAAKPFAEQGLSVDSRQPRGSDETEILKKINIELKKENSDLRKAVDTLTVKLSEIGDGASNKELEELRIEIEKYKILVKGLVADNQAVRERGRLLEADISIISGELKKARVEYENLKVEHSALKDMLENFELAAHGQSSVAADNFKMELQK